MSRYYIYDSVTDQFAEFGMKETAGKAFKAVGRGLKYAAPGMDKSIVGNVVRGGAGLAGAGAAGYGGYRMLTRGKRNAEPAPVDTSLRGRIRSLVGSAKAKASGAKASAKQGSAAAKKQYNKMTASARNQYAKLRGRGKQ
jgi:hypothetical protein